MSATSFTRLVPAGHKSIVDVPPAEGICTFKLAINGELPKHGGNRSIIHVDWCIAHNALKEFLKVHRAEVIDMLMTEWNLEDALVLEREEGREEGIEKVARTALAEGASLDLENTFQYLSGRLPFPAWRSLLYAMSGHVSSKISSFSAFFAVFMCFYPEKLSTKYLLVIILSNMV